MAKRNKHQHQGRKPAKRGDSRGRDEPRTLTLAERSAQRKPPTQYGKPFILLEDESKNTFFYHNGAWSAYERSIAECREDCQVQELPQKVNRCTRYEVREPV